MTEAEIRALEVREYWEESLAKARAERDEAIIAARKAEERADHLQARYDMLVHIRMAGKETPDA